jgi:hypothetical protein
MAGRKIASLKNSRRRNRRHARQYTEVKLNHSPQNEQATIWPTFIFHRRIALGM